jgi:hypothetical protein
VAPWNDLDLHYGVRGDPSVETAHIYNVVGNMPPPFNVTRCNDRLPSQPSDFTSASDPRWLQLAELSFYGARVGLIS